MANGFIYILYYLHRQNQIMKFRSKIFLCSRFALRNVLHRLRNIKIAAVLSAAAEKAGIPAGSIQLVEDTSRETVNAMLKLNAYLDVLIPRAAAYPVHWQPTPQPFLLPMHLPSPVGPGFSAPWSGDCRQGWTGVCPRDYQLQRVGAEPD